MFACGVGDGTQVIRLHSEVCEPFGQPHPLQLVMNGYKCSGVVKPNPKTVVGGAIAVRLIHALHSASIC